MKLNIVIPTRSLAEPFYWQAKESIISQLPTNRECDLFVVAGGGTCFDTAYLDAVAKSDADYVWLFSDDDILLPRAVETVLRFIKSREPDLIVAEATVFDRNLEHTLKPSFLGPLCSHLRVGQPDLAFQTLAPLMTYLGSIIVRRDLWLKAAERYAKDYIGSRYITFALPALCGLNKVQYIAQPLSGLRFGHQAWCRDAGTLDREFRNLVWKLPGIDYKAKSIVASPRPLWLRAVFAAQRRPVLAKLLRGALRVAGRRYTITHELLCAS